MNRKLIFFTVLFTLGVVSLFAFKQGEKTTKYLSVNISYTSYDKYTVTTIDENNVLTTEEKKRGSDANAREVNDLIVENEVINTIANKGYELIGIKSNKSSNTSFYFEKK